MCFRDRTPPLSVPGLAMAEPGIMFITPRRLADGGCTRGGLTTASLCRHQAHVGFMYTIPYVYKVEGYPSLSQTPSYNIEPGQTPAVVRSLCLLGR